MGEGLREKGFSYNRRRGWKGKTEREETSPSKLHFGFEC
jgi:hypothetical protein